MSPTRRSSTKSSKRPRKVKPKQTPRQRKIPKGLDKIKFCHYGVPLVHVFNNGDATPTVNQPTASGSVMSHVTPAYQEAYDTHLASYQPEAILPSNNFYHQIPESHDHATTYFGIEPYVPIPAQVPFQDGIHQAADHIPYIPYGRLDSQFMPLLNSAGGPSLDYNVEPYWFQQQSASYALNASTTPILYNDMYDATSTAMMINDGTMPLPFQNEDSGYYYM